MGFKENLANALERVKHTARSINGNILQTKEISRADRELLLKTNWLHPIIKGWYLVTRPDVLPGESTHWYANHWKFVSRYLNHQFGKNYCLSAECSIDLHTKSPTVPNQVIAIVEKRGGTPVQLPFNTSILPYKDPNNLPKERVELNGIQVMELGYALCKVTPSFFEREPKKIEIALRMIRTPDELLRPILKYGFQRSAERIIGAYRFLEDHEMADAIQSQLLQFGVRLKEENPFHYDHPITNTRTKSPVVARIMAAWKHYREVVIAELPEPPGTIMDPSSYFEQMEDIYKEDAYNSLSIEGYQVTDGLIEKVRNNNWNPHLVERDRAEIDALAARGYYEAFQEVKKSIQKVFKGSNSGTVIEHDLAKWYQSLFAPNVKAGILQPIDVVGYRKLPVYIRGSRHMPFPKESLLDAMETLFSCLKEEPHAGVRAILGHFIFVYIHPYMDGNGRIGRFLMNLMFASGGYPWTIIHVSNRKGYLEALEEASVNDNIRPFAQFIAKDLEMAAKTFFTEH